ncbi:unnamed protein product [Ascophyllum nodosum]
MKFGKNIGRVVELSDPEWSPFWMNYKFLKKKIKALGGPSGKVEPDSRSCPHAIAQSAGEVEFYKLLRQELRKCSQFFTSVEAQFVIRQTRVNEGWRQLLLPNIAVEGNPNRRLIMAACVKLYKDLLLLENFAIMNYCGFSKILKKHDKVTGFRTRESFMKNVVNQAPFVNYPKVIKMLSAVETLFQDIETLTTANASESAKARVPLREEQLFIDTMLTINTEAFRLQQEEGADIGLNTLEFSQKRDCFNKQRSPMAMARRTPLTPTPALPPSDVSKGLHMVAAAAAAHVVSRNEQEAGNEIVDEKEGEDKDVSSPTGTTDEACASAACAGLKRNDVHPETQRGVERFQPKRSRRSSSGD